MTRYRASGFFAIAVLALAMVFASGAPRAQGANPSAPITLIVPFAAGGGTDQVARAFAEALKSELGQPIAIQNLPGAGSATGTSKLHESKPDGYTIGMVGGFLVTTAVRGQLKVSASDFAHIARLSQETFVLAVPAASPHKTLKDLIDASRKAPGTVAMSTAGAGALTHLAAAALDAKTEGRFNIVHFQGGAKQLAGVLGGHADSGVFSQAEVLPQVGQKEGVRVLATFGAARSAVLPDIVTLKELGIAGVPAGPWQGFAAPKGLPEPLKIRLVEAARKAEQNASWRKFLTDNGLTPFYAEGAAFNGFIAQEIDELGGLLKALGLAS